mmetsp:Transcript_15942/g.32944  ORF Transcript_15942/g.32944 Transcript_15942/m.32944 type:complete len:245 (+) Transcript_15942:145-879(+)
MSPVLGRQQHDVVRFGNLVLEAHLKDANGIINRVDGQQWNFRVSKSLQSGFIAPPTGGHVLVIIKDLLIAIVLADQFRINVQNGFDLLHFLEGDPRLDKLGHARFDDRPLECPRECGLPQVMRMLRGLAVSDVLGGGKTSRKGQCSRNTTVNSGFGRVVGRNDCAHAKPNQNNLAIRFGSIKSACSIQSLVQSIDCAAHVRGSGAVKGFPAPNGCLHKSPVDHDRHRVSVFGGPACQIQHVGFR